MGKSVSPGRTRYTLSRSGSDAGAGGEATAGLTRATVRVSIGGCGGAGAARGVGARGGGGWGGASGLRGEGPEGAGRGATGGEGTPGVGAATGGEATGMGRTTTGIGVDSTPRLGGGCTRLAWKGASNCGGEAIAGFSSPTIRASRVTGREGPTKALKVPGSPTVWASIEPGREGSANSRSPKYCLSFS